MALTRVALIMTAVCICWLTTSYAGSASAGTETFLYAFRQNRGQQPESPLLDHEGRLFGTTARGGTAGCGTIFRISTSGDEKTLYTFQCKTDGYNPIGALVAIGSTLYGVTEYGGANASGTVFSITPDGVFTTIYAFGSTSNDLYYPTGGLVVMDGTLYGNAMGSTLPFTILGGVYSLTPQGDEHVIYSFPGGAGGAFDGAFPAGELLASNGTLYGVASGGGGATECGTVFSITPTGAITTLHAFTDKPDGCLPDAALINVDGTLYGTTEKGGKHKLGTVFAVSLSGTENVLYSFDGSVGAEPVAPLLDFKGLLYGTAALEGPAQDGTVFSVTKAGSATLVFDFSGSNGHEPEAGLTNLKGVLYGTTEHGGIKPNNVYHGFGTVFGITP